MRTTPRVQIQRVAIIDGKTHVLPLYVNRTVSGWQVRVSKNAASQHFADADYGGPVLSLTAAGELAKSQQRMKS